MHASGGAGEALKMVETHPPEVPGQAPTPRRFRSHGQEHAVRGVLKRWQDQPARARGAERGRVAPFGAGRAAAGAAEGRSYFRVRTEDGGVFDLAYDPRQGGSWYLLREVAAPASPGPAGDASHA